MKNSVVSISDDKMSVSLILSEPEEDEKYTLSYLLNLLEDQGVRYGIKKELLQLIIQQELYNEEYVVAEGKEKKDGRDGKYEFLFDTICKPKPVINSDGSIDYKKIQCFVPVKQGDLIAKYEKATAGAMGYTITGKLLMPIKGRELPRLKGKGFLCNETQTEYRAEISGKIELIQSNTICITNVFRVHENVDLSVGNIDFDGDVFINGDVYTGFTVQATGSIFVEGCVEACIIKAGKDIILKHGMQGADKGIVEAGQNIMGKFFEAVRIRCNGNFNANAIVNCQLEAEGKIEVVGRFGAIVGGNLYGRQGIEAAQIGNISGIKTIIQTGAAKKRQEQFIEIHEKIKAAENKLQILDYILSVYQKRKEVGVIANAELEDKKEKILYSKKEALKELIQYEDEKNGLNKLIQEGEKASIRVTRTIFDGTELIINSKRKTTKRTYDNVTICLKNGGIKIYKEE